MTRPTEAEYRKNNHANLSVIIPSDPEKPFFVSFGGGSSAIIGGEGDDHFYFDASSLNRGTYFIDGRNYKTTIENGALKTVNDLDTLHIVQSRDAFVEDTVGGLHRLTLKDDPSIVLLSVSVEQIVWGASPMAEAA